MNATDYIGFNKKTISYCAKQLDGSIRDQGVIDATRVALREWTAADGGWST